MAGRLTALFVEVLEGDASQDSLVRSTSSVGMTAPHSESFPPVYQKRQSQGSGRLS